MVTTDHVTPSHILLSCLHTPARLSNEHCVDIYFNINIAAIILSPDPLFTYGSPYTLHLGGIYVVYFYKVDISHHFPLLRYELKCCADGFKTKLFLHPGDPRPLTL